MNSCSISIIQFVEDDKVVDKGKASLLLPADIVVSYLSKASAKPFGSLPQDVNELIIYSSGSGSGSGSG